MSKAVDFSATKVSRPMKEIPGPKTGVLGDKDVEKIDIQSSKETNSPSKGLYGTAIAVGILLVLGGVFGGLGLLQSHYHFLPGSFDWLAKAVEFVGNLGPHHAVLWGLAAGGVLGIVAMAGGSVKVHQARMEEQRIEEQRIEEQERNRLITVLTTSKGNETEDAKPSTKDAIMDPIKTVDEIVIRPHTGKVRSDEEKAQNKVDLALNPVVSARIDEKAKLLAEKKAIAAAKAEEDQKALEAKAQELVDRKAAASNLTDEQLEAMFGVDFQAVKIDPLKDELVQFPNNKYKSLAWNKERRDDRFVLVTITPDGVQKCTGRIIKEEETKLIAYLESKGYAKE